MYIPGSVPSAHIDRYARDLLPPPETWPVFDYSAPNIARYPDRFNAAEWLIDAAVAAGFGDKIAYHCEGGGWTYRHLLDRAERIARVLVEDYGLVPGNRVLLRSENTPMVVACWLAVLKAGGICVTTMPLLRASELSDIVNRVQARFALCILPLAGELEAARSRAPPLERIGYFTALGLGLSAAADLDRAAEAKATGFRNVQTAADDIALIAFSSGTTSSPKSAAHFHRDILACTDCFPRVFTIGERDIVTGTPPLAFVYGLAAFLIYPLRYRASVALIGQPAPDNILATIARYRATSLYAVPTAYNGLLAEAGRYDIQSLEKCASAGEHLSPTLWEHWREATGRRIVNGIGCTELLSHFVCETMAVDRPGSTGREIPGYTARLVGEHGAILPKGSRGRMAVRGPTGCRYLADVERQKAFVQNGWNLTGDIFEQDEQGYFWFIGRADDIIVSAGYNISPQEVEEALAAHPLVRECAVVGVPDTVRGNLVRACIVLHDSARATAETASALQTFVKCRIAPYKYPRDIRFYQALPRTHTGKIKRNVLRTGSRV